MAGRLCGFTTGRPTCWRSNASPPTSLPKVLAVPTGIAESAMKGWAKEKERNKSLPPMLCLPWWVDLVHRCVVATMTRTLHVAKGLVGAATRITCEIDRDLDADAGFRGSAVDCLIRLRRLSLRAAEKMFGSK
jgi:hypothetical protein